MFVSCKLSKIELVTCSSILSLIIPSKASTRSFPVTLLLIKVVIQVLITETSPKKLFPCINIVALKVTPNPIETGLSKVESRIETLEKAVIICNGEVINEHSWKRIGSAASRKRTDDPIKVEFVNDPDIPAQVILERIQCELSTKTNPTGVASEKWENLDPVMVRFPNVPEKNIPPLSIIMLVTTRFETESAEMLAPIMVKLEKVACGVYLISTNVQGPFKQVTWLFGTPMNVGIKSAT